MNIYLIGFMGVGKSTVAKALSDKTGYELIDTDLYIEEKEGRKIREIFSKDGEEYFRSLERDTIRELSIRDNIIVSCGGGIIKSDDNINIMKSSGRVILLYASSEVIYNRVKDSDDRPLLKGKKSIEGILSLMNERQPLYDKACTDRVSADRPVDDIVEDIIKIIGV